MVLELSSDSRDTKSVNPKQIGVEILPPSVFTAQAGIQKLISEISGLGDGQGGVLSTMTLGADQTGLRIGTAMLDAAESGAKIDVFKCKRGGAFDGGESSGDGFVPLDISQRIRAWGLRKFYKNQENVLSPEITQEIETVRALLFSHPNFTLHNENYFEHGKLGLGYDIESGSVLWSSIGGASIRNEWGGVGSDQYIDTMVFLQSQWMRDILAQTLGGNNPGWTSGLKILTGDNYRGALDDLLSQNGEIRSSISYLGESQRISSLEDAELELFFSQRANVNRWRNLHFLHELFRRVNKGFHRGLRGRESMWDVFLYWKDFCSMPTEDIPDDFKVIVLEEMLHMKTITSGNMAITGSGNLVEKGYGELGLAMKKGFSQETDQMLMEIHSQLDTIFERNNTTKGICIGIHPIKSDLSKEDHIQFSLLGSVIEHAVMSIESFTSSTIHRRSIASKRKQREDFYRRSFKL